MYQLKFSSCNTGNPDVNNIANAFMDKINARKIVAWDGGTVFNYKKKKLLAAGPRTAQNTWNKHVERDENGNPIRKRQGEVINMNVNYYRNASPLYGIVTTFSR